MRAVEMGDDTSRGLADPSVDSVTVIESSPGLSAADVAVQVGLDPREIGRFQVLRRLGHGGMGVVYSAYDEELDRRVAIKLLRRDRLRDDAARQQFRAEAQAMARLSHPNVVQIYEVGEHAGQFFLAMEFVAGTTLRRWLQEQHPWRERLAVVSQAARGLAAAHAAGIVHRDFKPDNVMIDRDGRVRVLDFGLAQTDDDRAHAAAVGEVLSSSSSGLPSISLTRTIAGTPAYMSPEQHADGTIDARSDQFSLCVVLYEALYGQRPFHAPNVSQMAQVIARGQVRPPRRDLGIPRRIERAVLRGLAPDPQNRWPTVTDLVAAIEDDSARRRWQWWAAIAVVGSLATATAALLWPREPAVMHCRDAEDPHVEVWDAGRQAAVRAALLASDRPFAARAWDTVRTTLDAYAMSWTAMYRENCEATHVRGEQSSELFDLRMVCLRRAHHELQALVEVMTTADATTVENAARAVGALPRLEQCADVAALYRLHRPDEATRHAAEGVREALAPVKALVRVGKFAAAHDAVEPVLARAEAVGEPSSLAEVLYHHGDLAAKRTDYDLADKSLVRSFTLALAAEDDTMAVRVAIELIFVFGYFRAEYREAQRWADIAAALLDRQGEQGLLRARHASYVAVLLEAQGDKVAAAKLQRQGIALSREHGAPAFTIAAGLNNLAVSLSNSGELAAAIAAYEEALVLYRQVVGEDHPNYLATLDNLATAHGYLGHLDTALAQHLDANRRMERSLDPKHPNLAVNLSNIAGAYVDLGDPQTALAYAERSVAIVTESLGAAHPLALSCIGGLAHVRVRLGDVEAARAGAHIALAGLRELHGEDHAALALPLFVLAEVDLATGDPAAAVAGFTKVLQLRNFETGASHRELAESTFFLVRARWAAGEREGLAEQLAQARAHFAEVGAEASLREVAAWASEHL